MSHRILGLGLGDVGLLPVPILGTHISYEHVRPDRHDRHDSSYHGAAAWDSQHGASVGGVIRDHDDLH